MVIESFIIERERHSYKSAIRITKGSLIWLLDKHISSFGKILSIS